MNHHPQILNPDELAARRLLAVLGRVSEQMIFHRIKTRKRRGVVAVTGGLEIRQYASGPRVEGYIDATFEEGEPISWCLDVAFSEKDWTIDASMERSLGGGEPMETVKEIPSEAVATFDEFLVALERVTGQLLALEIED